MSPQPNEAARAAGGENLAYDFFVNVLLEKR